MNDFWYKWYKKIFFKLDPEWAHTLTLTSLKCVPRRFFPPLVEDPCRVMGIEFANRVGLAAGLDKNGDYIDALAKLGFGFIEVGTVTPKPQPGNPKPRLFRLPHVEALINRMGFNNKGVDHLVRRLKKCRYNGVIGVNIGKNLTTPVEKAWQDYQTCLSKVYPYAHYVTINISSPNTPGLRDLQSAENLAPLLKLLKQSQARLAKQYSRYVPLVVKLAPDIELGQLQAMVAVFKETDIDGVIATNTTNTRPGVEDDVIAHEAGGLSGKPLMPLATEVLEHLNHLLVDENIPIIGVGGMTSAEDAVEKIAAGANLLQLYTGLIFRGPALVAAINEAIKG